MYCIECGVKLADGQAQCPLCGTAVCHPTKQVSGAPLYPAGKLPKRRSGRKALCGAGVILYLIPLAVCFFCDLQPDRVLNWFGFVAGALAVLYVAAALPMWFSRPNPVIFVPCGFAAAALYLLYICLATGGNWYLGFGLPVTGCLCLIVTAAVTLLQYVKRGRLYIMGGASVALGLFLWLLEWLLDLQLGLAYAGWSVYPLAVLVLLGGLLIYLGISGSARDALVRKLFF